MILIDVGNTDTVLAIYLKNKIQKKIRIRSSNKKLIKLKITQFLINNKNHYIKTNKKICILSSVVPNLNSIIKKIFINNKFIFFNLNYKNIPFKLKINYEKKKIGADRLANTIAVINYKFKNCIIIDFGTATTFDVIKNNQYEGGLIFPGIQISHNSLIKNAALLKKIKITKINKIVSNNSKESIQSGFYWGYLCMINGVVKKIIKEKSIKPEIILTGGLAKTFKSKILFNPKIKENLTLNGLAIIGKMIDEK